MTRTPERRDREEGADIVLRESVGRVTFLDTSGEPAFLPPVDVFENASSVVIRMELPGVREKEVAVFVQGETIEVIGEKKQDTGGSEVSFLCLERTFGKFRRSFEVTGCVNTGLAHAVLSGGILLLRIPKCEERRGKRRRIKVASTEG